MTQRATPVAIGLVVPVTIPAGAAAQTAGVTPPPIPQDVNRARRGCHKFWHSDARAPSVVPKVSARAGLVYTYTKPPRSDGQGRLVPHRTRLRHGTADLAPPGG
jgi:hypothetical protein